MASEMLSGPDLGGGYLHQLTLDRLGDATTFTFHAQDGGSDAGGPPVGPLDVFGYVHPPSACQFGGPRCWHRRFLLPFDEIPRVRAAYNRFRFVLETSLAQVYGSAPVAVDAALTELIRRVAPTLAAEGVGWYIGGSLGARLLGADVAPHDIDLGTTRAGVDRIAQLIPEYLVEPLGPTDWPGRGIVRGARAFVGTFREGARVEWAVPIEPTAPSAVDEWSGHPDRVRTTDARFAETTVRVSRPEYALVRAAARHQTERIPLYAALVRNLGPDHELLDALVVRAALDDRTQSELRRAVAV